MSDSPPSSFGDSQTEFRRKTTARLAIGLALLAFAAYVPVLNCGFVNYDDGEYVFGNEHVVTGLTRENIRWSLTTDHIGLWNPLTWLSLQFDATIFGTNPFGFHLTNLLLHIANVVLLFFAVQRLLGRATPGFIAAALFAVHPLHVQSVVWVSDRKDVLCLFFWLIAFNGYVSYAARPRWFNALWVIVAFELALFAKPLAVTFPCVLLLLDFWPLRRWPGRASVKRIIGEKLPLFAASAIVCGMAVRAERAWGTLAASSTVPPSARLANVLLSYCVYLRQAVWPSGLTVLYPLRIHDPSEASVVACAAFLFSVTAIFVWESRRRPYLIVGWLWYLGTLVPMIGILQVGEIAHADRYTYLPMIGIYIAIACGLSELFSERQFVWRPARLVGGMVLLALTIATWHTISDWKNGESLWRRALAVSGETTTAHALLAESYRDRGEYDEAARHLQRAVELTPERFEIRRQLAWVLTLAGRIDEADDEFHQSLPRSAWPSDDRPAVIDESSPILAAAQYVHTLRRQPNDARAHLGLARQMIHLDYIDAAKRHLERAQQLEPGLAKTPEFQAVRRLIN